MQGSEFGPLASIMAVAAALVAVFGALVLKAVGPLGRWTSLISDTPLFLVGAGPRVASIATIAATFVLIDRTNYEWFLVAAGVFGVAMFVLIVRFDLLRRSHTCEVPLLDANGNQATDAKGRLLSKHVAIGSEEDMKPHAKAAYEKNPGISLCKFIGGYGRNGVNDPAAIWDQKLLAKLSNRMVVLLMSAVLCATTGLFIAAAVVDVSRNTEARLGSH